MKSRKINKSSLDRLLIETEEIKDRALKDKGESWEAMSPEHWVALYYLAHKHVYSVAPDEVCEQWDKAVAAAERTLRECGGDKATMGHYMQWTWRREEKRNETRDKSDAFRLGWRLQFGAQVLGDYRVACAKNGRKLPAPVEVSEPATPQPSSDRYQILIDPADEAQMVLDALEALGNEPNVYQRGGQLVTVTSEPPPSKVKTKVKGAGPRIVALTRYSLHEMLARNAQFLMPAEKENQPDRPIPVPKHLPMMLVARPEYPAEFIQPLVGLSSGPILREDGTIHRGPGYDEQTGVLVTHAVDIDVPEDPTREDAVAAVDALREVVNDFPFAGDEHFSAWLAALLTLTARHLVDGCVPMIAVDANVRGAGKGLLVDVASIIASGHVLPRATEPTENSETRKVLTSIALAGHPAVLIDNVEHTLDSPQLAAALTAEAWNDRLLGVNKDISIVWRTVLLCTGNNLGFSSDLLRRVLHIRLESPLEQPEERADVEHVDLRGYVRQHRGELLSAVLTILRAWLRAGMPSQGVVQWGSFEGWSRVIRECVVWLGLPDPAATRRELQRVGDTEVASLRTLLDALAELDPHCEGLTAQEILDRAEDEGLKVPLLSDALAQLCPGPPGKSVSAQSLGYRLRKLKGRVVDGLALDSMRTKLGARWVARRVVPAGGRRG